MADITKCSDKECPKAKQCYRFTAISNEFRQSYFVESPRKLDNSCFEFWPDSGLVSKRKVNEKWVF